MLKNDEGKEEDIAVQDGAGSSLNLSVEGLMQERDLRLPEPPITYWQIPVFLSLKHQHFNVHEPNARNTGALCDADSLAIASGFSFAASGRRSISCVFAPSDRVMWNLERLLHELRSSGHIALRHRVR